MPTQSFVVLAQQARAAQTWTSSSVTIPSTVTFVRIFANISLAEKLSTGLKMDLEVQRSTDSGVTWSDGIGAHEPPVCGFGWTSYGPGGYPGGPKGGPDNPDPSVGFDPQAYKGQLFRAVAKLTQPLTVGMTIDITT